MSYPIRTVTIGQICKEGGGNVQTGPFGSQLKAAAYVPSGIPTIMPVNLIDYRVVEEGIAQIGPADHARLSKHHLRPGDIVYGRRGDIGRHALITDRESDWLCGTGCLRIRFGSAPIHPLYASYYLRQPQVIELILGLAVGTTMPNLNTSILESIRLDLPPLPIQQRIAEILGRLDDKIEVNRRINRTLEQMAQALYKEWFVDFGPFQDGAFVESALGLIPAGWGVSFIGELGQIVSGATPSTKVAEYWDGGEICWATPTDMTALTAPAIFDTSRKITQVGLENCSASLLPVGSVLVTTRATLGYVAINYVPMATNQGFKSIVCGPRVTNNFMLLHMQDNRDELINRANGSIFLEINASNFKSIPVIVPDQEVMHKFDGIVARHFEQISVNAQESAKLAATRDYLLPRLLSGALSVDVGEEMAS